MTLPKYCNYFITARVVNIAPLDQVAPGAVNVDIGQLLRHQEDELQNLGGLIRQRNEELEEIRRQIAWQQQQQQQQPPVQDDEEESEEENENGGQQNIPAGENDTPQQGHQAIDRAGAPESRIPRPMTRQREESSSSSETANTDSSTVQRRNSPRPTASSQLQAARRLSMGLPSTPTSSQAEGRQPRSAAQISERKTKILAKNKLI